MNGSINPKIAETERRGLSMEGSSPSGWIQCGGVAVTARGLNTHVHRLLDAKPRFRFDVPAAASQRPFSFRRPCERHLLLRPTNLLNLDGPVSIAATAASFRSASSSLPRSYAQIKPILLSSELLNSLYNEFLKVQYCHH